jgi:hypothetical protein
MQPKTIFVFDYTVIQSKKSLYVLNMLTVIFADK